ncbi:TrmH family RNA methyltransferase [Hymenobacter daeguensis]
MENPTDRPDRPERPQRPARPVAGRRFYDGANRPVTPKQFRPDRRADEFDDRPARPRGRGGSDNRDDFPAERGEARPPYRSREGGEKPRYENRPAQNASIDMLFGLRPILEALSAGRTLEKIFLLRGTQNSLVTDISTAARAAGIQVQMVPVEKLDNLTRKNHQGAVAFVSPIDYAPLDNIVSGLFEEGKVPFLLLLDRITDVRNFGAIARTAECLGVQAIVVPSRGAAQINGDALKTSAGALNILPVCREVSLHETVRFLQQSGITVVACTEKAEEAVGSAEIDFTGPVAVLMGSEEDGISPDLLNLADVKLKVPMTGQIQSLNVGVAAGIMLFEVARQRVSAE